MQLSRRATVLVGDDEPLLRNLTERILAPQGFRVLKAADTDEAVQLVEVTPEIDVVLLDATMPPRGVGDALGTIRAHLPRVGVILTSGEALSRPLARELDACDGLFLRKPFAPDALLRAVEQMLDAGSG